LPEALACFERSLTLAAQIGYRDGERAATGNLGLLSLTMGRYVESASHIARSLHLSRELADREGEMTSLGNLGIVDCCMGRYADAMAHYARHSVLAAELGNRSALATSACYSGYVLLPIGQIDGARREFERYLTLTRELGERPMEAWALHAMGDVADAAGDWPAAERWYDDALELRRAIGVRREEATTLLGRGLVRAEQLRITEARQDLSAALGIARELALPDVLVGALCHLATFPGGDVAAAADAVQSYGARIPLQQRMEARHLLWQATHDRAHLAEAKRLLDFMVEHAPPECRESMVANVRLHREIVAAAKEAGL
jgi:tetratricopeptide (TPR) repeat protein